MGTDERRPVSLRGLDHVAFGDADVALTRQKLARLGFRPPPPGECHWSLPSGSFRARSLSVMFPGTYLDFIENDTRAGLAPSGLVLGTQDLTRALAQLDSAGLERLPEYEIERTLTTEQVEPMGYRIAPLDLRPHAGVFISLLQDLDPEAMRRDDWLSHPNGVNAIVQVSCGTPDLDAIAAWSERVFGGGRVARHDDSVAVETGTARIVWLRRAGRARILRLSLASNDLSAAERALRAGQVPYRSPGSRLLVGPADGVGCELELVGRC